MLVQKYDLCHSVLYFAYFFFTDFTKEMRTNFMLLASGCLTVQYKIVFLLLSGFLWLQNWFFPRVKLFLYLNDS